MKIRHVLFSLCFALAAVSRLWAITFVGAGASSAVEANGANPTPGLPAGIVEGDTLMIVMSIRSDGVSAVNIPGYTQQWSMKATNGRNLRVFTKVADTGEAAPAISIVGRSAGQTAAAVVVAYRGVDPVSPIDTVATEWLSGGGVSTLGPIPAPQPNYQDGAFIFIGGRNSFWTSVSSLSGNGLTWANAAAVSASIGNSLGFVVTHAFYSGLPPVMTSKSYTVTGGSLTLGSGKAFVLRAVGAAYVPMLTPSTFSAPPQTAINVAIDRTPGNPTDWVGLFQVGSKSQYPASWSYLNGTQTPPAAGLTSATLPFTLPDRPTNYEFRFFVNGGTTPVVTTPRVLVQSPTMPPPPAAPLPFDPLSYETYNSQVRKVVVHHHAYTMKGGPSVQNLDGFDPAEWWNDALTDGFNQVGGAACDGGGVRSRPYPLPILSGVFGQNRWATEFQDYKNAGVDFVFLNGQPASGSGGTSGDRMEEALNLAATLGGIKVAMNIDFAGVTSPNQPSVTAVAAAAWAKDHVFNKPAYMKDPVSGRYYVGAFLTSSYLVQWYKDFVNACEAQGTPVAFVPSSNYNRTTTLADYQDLGPDKFSGYGAWAGRSLNSDFTGEANAAWNNGQRTYIWPVAPADFRVYKGSYVWDESNGPRQFINQWTRAVAYKTPADPLWVQHSTGTDQLEGTATWPTTGANYLWMDLSTWFMHALKMGSYPTIVRDGLMYCHRTQHHTLRGHSDRHSWTYPWNGITPESNIYAIAFPTEDSTVEISLGSHTASFPVPGGVMSVVSLPFAADESGAPVFRMLRHGAPVVEITSKFPIVTSIPFTDPEYKGGSSLRPGTFDDTSAPFLTLPANLTLEATGPDGAVAMFAASAHDFVDGDVPVTLSPASGSVFPLGVTTVTASASDALGYVATGSFTVTVRDTMAPTLTLPANIVAEATSAAGGTVDFTASASDIVSGPVAVSFSQASGSVFPLGITTVTASATDAAGNTSTGTFTVTVRDTTAPLIGSLSASPASLWPPNHKMVAVALAISVTDLADQYPDAHIVSVVCNETTDASDWQITGPLSLQLRAERDGAGSDRVYTITVEARDAAGNIATRDVTVTVPHDQSH
ncbi:exported hypothetical protein [uncultured Defluviicoccus sp.]|uniref:HYR domain-containing protein n=1 Tax=metagenome TaxID=256318 RepID=A0A380TFX0_9ZZZZ|nr:exported hypothetical protein [uncultured Defluviicoccus sp.]